jgi:hypothetical protein
MVKKFLELIICLMSIGYLFGAEKYVTIEVDTVKIYPLTISVAEARIKTLQEVRQVALERALPQDISLTTFISSVSVEKNNFYDEQVASSVFMNCCSSGRIIEEKILEDYPSFPKKSNVFEYRMKYRATILPLKTIYNSELDLKVQLSETLLKNNEQFTLELTPNQDGYLYIFDFLPDNSVLVVYPTLHYPESLIIKDTAWKQTLTAVTSPDKKHSIETLYFVFSEVPISGWENFKSNSNFTELIFSAGEESFILFQKWLGRSDPNKRVEKMAQLHIFQE